MSKQKLVIIDSDSLCYTSSRDTLEESIQVLNEKIQNIYDKTEATHSILLISKGRYFRHDVSNGTYKASRGKYQNNLKFLRTLKSYLEEQYNAYSMKGTEADDIAAWLMNQEICISESYVSRGGETPYSRIETKNTFESVNCLLAEDGVPLAEFSQIDVVLASPDKDLLKSIVGTHFNYSYRLEDKTKPESVEKGWWVTTDKFQASEFVFEQMVCGDVTDGIKGIEGKGSAFYKSKHWDILVVMEEYITRYGYSQGIYEFQKNYRLLHLLSTDEDYLQEIGELPIFPTVNEIKPKEEIIEYT